MTPDEVFDFDASLHQRVLKRRREDQDSLDNHPTIVDLLAYTDFSDCVQILQAHKLQLSSTIQAQLPFMNGAIKGLAPVRNRVMHMRPLHFDDVARTMSLAEELSKRNRSLWPQIQVTLSRLAEEPSFVLSLDLPIELEPERVSHNLPIPDFDETGFIGRDAQLKSLIDLCKGPYPVITIVAEGGVGKTALALKTAYEVLDLSPAPFDAVVWTSAKTTALTASQIVAVEGAIRDSLGMLSVASEVLSPPSTQDPISELLEYLSTFRILLVLDNLETVLDERIRTFLAKLPAGSKVLITSRIGVGAFEYPVRLEPLASDEAIQLIRSLTKARGLSRLLSIPNKVVANYCQQMNNNPGHIKWFVSAVQAGSRPEEALGDPSLFLDYCMSNVYDYLSSDSKKVLQSLQHIAGPRSQAELAFLSELDSLRLQRALQQLLSTNMVSMLPVSEGSSFHSKYEVSDMAREYLMRRHPVPTSLASQLQRRRRELVRSTEEIAAGRRTNPYSFSTIQIRSQSDQIVAKYLSDAILEVHKGNHPLAETRLAEAKRLAPEFFEVHRVEAYLRVSEDNYSAANQCYEAAVELEPNSATLRTQYGGFLMRYMDDVEAAFEHLTIATRLDPSGFEPQRDLALACLALHRFEDAEKIVKSLLGRVISSERGQRSAFDLMLQLYERRARNSASNSDFMIATSYLEELRKVFENIPVVFVDAKMHQKLRSDCDGLAWPTVMPTFGPPG